jgi:hypothetical protein
VAFIQEKLNLIMAGEESTVGGVTVQQYLAEVERITDPTLTSTYEKLFKEAAKYRKTRFIIPL